MKLISFSWIQRLSVSQIIFFWADPVHNYFDKVNYNLTNEKSLKSFDCNLYRSLLHKIFFVDFGILGSTYFIETTANFDLLVERIICIQESD